MARIELQPVGHSAPIAVHLEKTGDELYAVGVEATDYTLQLHWESFSGGWVRNTETGEIHSFYLDVSEEVVQLWIGGKVYGFTRTTPQSARQKSKGGGALDISGKIKAPMPGTVLKVLVAAGDAVLANAPLLIMESMKMEMTLTAPMDASVTHIFCEVGQLVEMNTILVQLEAGKNASDVS